LLDPAPEKIDENSTTTKASTAMKAKPVKEKKMRQDLRKMGGRCTVYVVFHTHFRL
jgi:hypothetical protein